MTQAVSTARIRTWGAACSLRSYSKKGRCHLNTSNCSCSVKVGHIGVETQPAHEVAKGINASTKIALAKHTQLTGALWVSPNSCPTARCWTLTWPPPGALGRHRRCVLLHQGLQAHKLPCMTGCAPHKAVQVATEAAACCCQMFSRFTGPIWKQSFVGLSSAPDPPVATVPLG